MAARHPEPEWALMEATSPAGAPALIMAMRPLKPVDHPLLDLLGEIRHQFK